MSVIKSTRSALVPMALAVAVACVLPACKQDAPVAEPVSGQAQQAPAPTPQSVVSASVAAMSPDQLRSEASKAFGENRLYAPAGSNAMEYYLALRDKQPADAGASSALSDLMPMTVIATEQGIAREDFAEAKRLAALIEKADARHPALGRLKASIASTETAVASRAETQKLTAAEEAIRIAEQAKQREEDQRRLQEQQRQQAAAAPAAPTAEQQRAAAAADQARAAEAERQRIAAAAERQRQQAPATPQPAAPVAQPARAASSELRAVSQPGPRYPASAQRAGVTADVQVEFTVSSDGGVTSARVVSTDGGRQYTREFEREALAAVKRWRFQPVAEPTTSRRTISFQQ